MTAARLGRRGAFWTAAAVLGLCLWSSGAPSVLYPLYAQRWQLTPVTITAIFATYPLVLLITLVVFGSLSDVVGRRRVMIAGMALITIAAVLFACAPHVAVLFAGRVLQGAGAGLSMGAATAALVENNVTSNPRFASAFTTVSTSAGLTVALTATGLLVQFAPLPFTLSYLLLFVLGSATMAALLTTRDDRPAGAGRWRASLPRLAPRIRLAFATSALSVALAFCVGAIVLSLGAEMIQQFTGTHSAATTGLLLAASSAAIGITGLFLARVPARAAIWVGIALTLVSLVMMAAITVIGSLGLFLAWCLVGGVAYSFALTGGLGLINRVAPVHHRGATLSLVYLAAYFLQAVTVIGTGQLATSHGLGPAAVIMAVVISTMCLMVATLLLAVRRSRGDS